MKRARVDDNQNEIVAALRRAGCTVQLLHRVGQGCPDLLVGRNQVNSLLEIKDGKKPPSKRILTPDQVIWHRDWRGHVEIVQDIDQALRAAGVDYV